MLLYQWPCLLARRKLPGSEWCGECVEESDVGSVWRSGVERCGGEWCGECVEESGVGSVWRRVMWGVSVERRVVWGVCGGE